MPNTTAWPSWPASTAPLRSRLPVSTATARWTGLVWPSSAPMTCGSHAAPSCATITAVTTCWGYVSFGDKGSACSSGGHPQFRRAHRRHRPRGPGTSCTIREVTTRGRPDGALRGIRAGQPSGGGPDARPRPTAPACAAWSRGAAGSPGGRAQPLHRLPLQPAALALGQPAPDPESLIVLQRIFQALGPDFAAAAHPLRFPGGSALLREERLRIGLRAEGPVLPAHFPGIVVVHAEPVVHQRDDDLSHSAPTPPKPRRLAPRSRGPRELHG